MRDYEDPLSLNKTTSLFDYNCYGFAFHSLDWEEPAHYDLGQKPEKMLSECVKDILREHPDYKLCGSYNDVPESEDCVGFRISVYKYPQCEDEVVGDFHFILRHKGKWYHKPGSWEIEEVNFEIEEPWPHHNKPYNSEIHWFTRG